MKKQSKIKGEAYSEGGKEEVQKNAHQRVHSTRLP